MEPDLQEFKPDYPAIDQAMRLLVEQSHGAMVKAGWHTDLKTGERMLPTKSVISEKIALIHSELSEALEADRKKLMDDKIPTRNGVEVELADAVLRVTDTIGELKMTDHTRDALFLILTLPRQAVAFAMVLRSICELVDEHGLDLAGATAEKAAFNAVRADHKVETRLLENGKGY